MLRGGAKRYAGNPWYWLTVRTIMQLPRFFGFVDLAVATVVVVAIVLPPREMSASSAIKGDDASRFELALAEARVAAHPDDGRAAEDLVRRLDDASFKDWAIEAALRASDRAKASPTRWRALLAASVAYVDRLDVKPGLDYANRALESCAATRPTCPSWEEVRMQFYQRHLDAGVKSGIDPRRDPSGFRRAGESAVLQVHLNGDRGPRPAPAGSASGSDR